MMDPLSCLGLVSNIVQLISAAVDAFSLCHQVYTLGASIEDSQMGYTSEQLHQCYSALDNSLQRNVASGLKALSSGVDLGDLVLKCCETATELQTELQSLRTSSNRGFRETALKVLSKKRKAKKINKLKSRLDEYQRVLDSKLLIDIRHVCRYDSWRQQLTPWIKAVVMYLGNTLRRATLEIRATALTNIRKLDHLSHTLLKPTQIGAGQGYQS